MAKKIYILSIIDEGEVVITKASINKQKLIDFVTNVYFPAHGYTSDIDENIIKILRSDLKKYNSSNMEEYIGCKFKIEETELI